PVASASAFAMPPALVATVRVGLSIRRVVGQARPFPVGQFHDAWSLRPKHLSTASPAGPRRLGPSAIPGSARRAGSVWRRNSGVVLAVVFEKFPARVVTGPVGPRARSVAVQSQRPAVRHLAGAGSPLPSQRLSVASAARLRSDWTANP